MRSSGPGRALLAFVMIGFIVRRDDASTAPTDFDWFYELSPFINN